MVVRTAVEIKPDERKRLVERELSNFMKREHEFIARERRERAAQLGGQGEVAAYQVDFLCGVGGQPERVGVGDA